MFYDHIFTKLVIIAEQEDEKTDQAEEVVSDNENADRVEEVENTDKEDITATDMIDELYTKPTTSVEDITKVMEDFLVV